MRNMNSIGLFYICAICAVAVATTIGCATASEPSCQPGLQCYCGEGQFGQATCGTPACINCVNVSGATAGNATTAAPLTGAGGGIANVGIAVTANAGTTTALASVAGSGGAARNTGAGGVSGAAGTIRETGLGGSSQTTTGSAGGKCPSPYTCTENTVAAGLGLSLKFCADISAASLAGPLPPSCITVNDCKNAGLPSAICTQNPILGGTICFAVCTP
jgi:hypothetical protein